MMMLYQSFSSFTQKTILPWVVESFSLCIVHRSHPDVHPLFIEWTILRRKGRNYIFFSIFVHECVVLLFFDNTCIDGKIYC